MEFWFSELHTDNVKASIRCEKQLYSGQSDFQRIDVFDSAEFGRFLVSNGSVIFSDAPGTWREERLGPDGLRRLVYDNFSEAGNTAPGGNSR